jgi:hypothetical protein
MGVSESIKSIYAVKSVYFDPSGNPWTDVDIVYAGFEESKIIEVCYKHYFSDRVFLNRRALHMGRWISFPLGRTKYSTISEDFI